METPHRFILPPRRAALLATACLVFPLTAGEPTVSGSPAQRELAARYQSAEEAQMLLRKGDESYYAGEYADAVEAYAGARELLPDAPITANLRDAATERFALASIAHARDLNRRGDLAAANAALDQVLLEGVAPDHALAQLARAELDDPIRNNPALTAEHAANVDSVRKLLYTAEGAYNLGDFDRSKALYENVLKIDPHNRAARRGMERVASQKTAYQRAAYDHTRAEMLAEVDAAWEMAIPLPAVDLNLGSDQAPEQLDFIPVANKLDRIILPSVNFDEISLDEALEFLRVRSAEFDQVETDPARRGVNFNLDLGGPDSEAGNRVRSLRFSLKLNGVPLRDVLGYVTEQTRTTYTTDPYSVTIRPLGVDSGVLVSRTHRVPPRFLTSLNAGSTGAAETADPFAAPATSGLLPRRLGAMEALRAMGVTFPEGASASYNANSNSLLVVNTEANQSIIEDIVSKLGEEEPIMVAVRVQIIRTQETRLNELGFDWLLGPTGFGGNNWIPGTNPTYLHGGTQGNGGDLSDIALPFGQLGRNPVTAGNRSGEEAIGLNSIDSVIGVTRDDFRSRAPGVFQLTHMDPTSSVQMMMRGLDQKKGVDLMATPAVLTRSGQEASVHIVREFIYPTNYEPPELPNSVGSDDVLVLDGEIFAAPPPPMPVTPATPTDFKKEDIGVILNVLPIADRERGLVNLTFNPSFVDFDGFINYGTPITTIASGGAIGGGRSQTQELTPNAILQPVFSKMQTSTTLDVADGATLVYGGLVSNTIQDVEDQTPILGSIPVIGRLFQSKSRQPVSTAIVFLVTVEMVDPAGRPLRDR